MRSCIFLPALLLGFVACSKDSAEPSASDGGASDGALDAGRDPRYDFPSSAPNRTCAQDTDCVVLPVLSQCSTCCNFGGVARGEAEQAYQATVDACSARPSEQCLVGCGTSKAACFEGTCVSLGEPLPNSGDGASQCPPQTTSGTAPELGAGPNGGATPVHTGFEDGLDPSWAATSSAAFQIDRTQPIAGAASLRIAYKQTNDYLTITQPNASAIRVAFTIRTHFLSSGGTVARIVAGDGWWFHVLLGPCMLSVAEETRTAEAAGIGFGNVSWPMPDDTPVRVVLTFDLTGKTMTSTAAPLGQPLPAPKSTPLRGSGAGVRAVELGAAPGVVTDGVGSVWLDDLVID